MDNDAVEKLVVTVTKAMVLGYLRDDRLVENMLACTECQRMGRKKTDVVRVLMVVEEHGPESVEVDVDDVG